MTVSAIISEYDPFHNGHKYQIEQTRAVTGATHIVAIMSGNFTQRGAASTVSKHIKAKIALLNGCDLVVEIPVTHTVSNAERFSLGAISLATALGCVDFLSFGCENNNIELLQKAAKVAESSKVIGLTKQRLKSGISFAKARYNAIDELYGADISDLFLTPNNILAMEYLKALARISSTIKPVAILRKGATHNSIAPSDHFASSSFLRKILFDNYTQIEQYIPKSCYNILQQEIKKGAAPASLLHCERAVLARLRCMSASDFKNIPDISEGLENRLYQAVQSSCSLAEVISKTKSKRYTQLRIQRIVLAAFLGLNKDLVCRSPLYIKVLGFNKKGAEILHIAKETATLPIITKPADAKKFRYDPKAAQCIETEARAQALYNLMLPKVQPCVDKASNGVIKIDI